MSKAKSSTKVSVVNASEVPAEAVNAAVEATAKKQGLVKGAKADALAKLTQAIEDGRLTFVQSEIPNVMTAVSSSGVKYEMTLIEEESARATTSGKKVTCQIVGRKFDEEGNVIVRTAILNGREIWTKYNPDYKFPSKSGKAKVDPNKPKREPKPKAPSVVHSIDDMI